MDEDEIEVLLQDLEELYAEEDSVESIEYTVAYPPRKEIGLFEERYAMRSN